MTKQVQKYKRGIIETQLRADIQDLLKNEDTMNTEERQKAMQAIRDKAEEYDLAPVIVDEIFNDL